MQPFKISDGKVVLVEKSANPGIDGYDAVLESGWPFHVHPAATPDEWAAITALIASGDAVVEPYVAPPAPTEEQIKTSLIDAVQKHMDDAARAYGYDDIKSAVTYADEPIVAKFQAEGRAFRAWRSLVWAHSASVLEAVQAGTRSIPTRDELIAELPPFDQVAPS